MMAKHVRLVYEQKAWVLEVPAMTEASLIYKQVQHFHTFARLFPFVVTVFVLSTRGGMVQDDGDTKVVTRHSALNKNIKIRHHGC